MRVSIALVASVLFVSEAAAAQTSGTLSATVSLAQHDYAKDADVEVTVSLANGTAHVVDVAAQVLQTAVLLCDVRDAAGHHVATVSPPVPTLDVVHFAPGQTRVVKVRLGVFSPPLRSGDYVVGPASAVASGSSVPFRIR